MTQTEQTAENTVLKLTSNKEILSYISTLFPKCFILEGDAKPLKIGIFQELADRLKDDECVSKTQLRGALRQYTSSWRYLHCVKEGVERVDLDGNPCGVLEAEHVEHAQKTLAESKARVQARRKEQAAEQRKEKGEQAKKPNSNKSAKPNTQKNHASKNKVNKSTKTATKAPSAPKTTPNLSVENIVVGKEVHINMGQGNMPATIVEVNKNDIRVRLNNGLQMGVKPENIHE